MMTTLCPHCQAQIPERAWDRHIAETHPAEIERYALLAIESAEDQVAWLYSNYPETKQDNGLLLFHFAKGYPKLKLYEENNNYIIQAPYDNFFYFLKRANSITRLGRHLRQPERTGETLTTSGSSLKTNIKTTEAVKQVLMEVPQARYSEGILSERVLRYFQPQGIEMQYKTGEITLKAPKSLMLAVLRHLETISRASRKLRATLKFEGNSAVPEKREIEFDYSTHEWASRSGNDWLPNTYIPMRD